MSVDWRINVGKGSETQVRLGEQYKTAAEPDPSYLISSCEDLLTHLFIC